tara:strand:- start:273 stop:1178 length:906 start_codon:yes stop_codon:yes gene_type:complete
MAKTLREVIKETTKSHVRKKIGKVYGQCLNAVDWIEGTVPNLKEKDGLVDLSMADVANGGIVVGAGLIEKPIYIIRFQGLNWFNAPIIINYACKSKEIWNIPCPILIRSIGMEGSIGPVTGSSHHSIYLRMPGVKIVSPMTPNEYKKAYNYFIKNDDVLYLSEHSKSYSNSKELLDKLDEKTDLIIFAISITRFQAYKIRNYYLSINIKISVANIFWIKPFLIKKRWIDTLKKSKYGGLLLDDDYVNGSAKTLAYELHKRSKKTVYVLGLEDRSAGFSYSKDNLSPSFERIKKEINKIFKK